jgi:putative ATPase
MIEGGEDPRFVIRRLVIFASEDVGNADPRALQLAVACKEAVDLVGLPEGFYALSQCAIYLALAPKSNSAGRAYGRALEAVREHGALPVPLHLRNAPTRLTRSLGYGEGYRYPHEAEDGWVDEQYLPDRLAGRRFYEPTERGLEQRLGERLRELARRRERARDRRR